MSVVDTSYSLAKKEHQKLLHLATHLAIVLVARLLIIHLQHLEDRHLWCRVHTLARRLRTFPW